MSILICNYILCLLYSVYLKFTNLCIQISDRIFQIITFLQLLFIHSMVDIWSVKDLEDYERIFSNIDSYSWLDCITPFYVYGIEPGFVIINKLVNVSGGNFRSLLWIYSFTLLLCYYRVISKLSPDIKMSIILFIVTTFNQSLFVLRQHWGLAILLLSYDYIIKRKFASFTFVWLLAMSFHVSAIIFFPIYFVYRFKGKKLLFVLFLLSLLFSIVLRSIFVIATAFLDSKEAYEYSSSTVTIIPLVICGFLLFSYLLLLRDKVFQNGINKLCFIFLFIAFCNLFTGIGMSGTIIRLNLYFTVATIFSVPLAYKSIHNLYVRLLYVCSVLILYTYTSFYSFSAGEFRSFKLAGGLF